MALFLKRIHSQEAKKAEKTFSPAFLENLKPPYLEQKKIKNLILKEQLKLTEEELLKANENYHWKSDFFSSSYSGDWLFLAITQQKVGVDIEIIKTREKSLLLSYQNELVLHFGGADRNKFYLLRTAKEAVLKASDTANLDEMDNIKVLKIQQINSAIEGMFFGREWQMSFQGRRWKVKSYENGEIAYSIGVKE